MGEGNSFKDRIAQALAALVGMILWDSGRAADLEWFIFGPRKIISDFHGKPREVGEYSLHVQCAWRITHRDRVLVGSRDLYYPAGYTDRSQDIPRDFNWEGRGSNRRDQLIAALFDNGKRQIRVMGLEVGAAGAFALHLEDEMALEVFPHDALSGERWRLFRPGDVDSHFVVTGEGIEN